MKHRNSKSMKIGVALRRGETVSNIAAKVKCTKALVYAVKRKMGSYGIARDYIFTPSDPILDKVENIARKINVIGLEIHKDMVNSPAHYTVGGIEVADFIRAKSLSYGRGNVVKYVTRAGVKDKATELEDLQKAAWYLASEITALQGAK